jgi:hypothetical protein
LNIIFLEQYQMTSLNRSHPEEITHEFNIEIFGEQISEQNYTSQNPNPRQPYYQQNLNPPDPYYQQFPQQYYPSQNPDPSSSYNFVHLFVHQIVCLMRSKLIVPWDRDTR